MNIKNGHLKVPVNRQIIAVFIIVSLLLVVIGMLNYKNVQYYQNNIRYIRNSSIEQLIVINRIENNSALLEIMVLQHILARNEVLKKEYAGQVYKYINQNHKLFEEFNQNSLSQEIKIKLTEIEKQWKFYIQDVIKIMNLSDEADPLGTYIYAKGELRPVFAFYQLELQALSQIIIEDAERTVFNTARQIKILRRISTLLIIAGIIILLVLTYTIFRIVKKLRSDYELLKKESFQNQRAQAKIQQLNEQLEERVKQRTLELEKINLELISLQTIIDMSDNSIIIRDLNDKILYWNKGAEILYGCTKEEALNQNCHVYFERILPDSIEEIKKELFERENWHGEIYIQSGQRKETIIVSSRWTLHRDEKNEPVSILEIDHDISQRKRMEEEIKKYNDELREINHAKDKIFSVISHDLRSPVNGLLSSSQVLLKDLAKLNKSEIRQFSEIIFRTSKKMLKQLNDLVKWAKSQQKKGAFNPEKLQLNREAFHAIKILKINADQKGIQIRNKIPENIFVHADANMIVSIFQNILSNSIKFTPSGGSITLTAVEKETEVEVTVQDTGMGMNPEIQEQLFSGEVPISTSGTKKETGSGLGLILVKDFVEKHRGSIKIDSEPGRGTTFCFTLPSTVSKVIDSE